MFNQSLADSPKIYVIHENGEWTKPLFDALTALGVAFEDWDMSQSIIDISMPPPEGIFYNRMSASSHTRGNRFSPESTVGLLAWLEAAGRTVLNGRSALHLELSKLVQYTALTKAGLPVPHTVAVSRPEDILSAYRQLPFQDAITKHNRAGKGLGVQLLKSEEAVRQHIESAEFEPSVDGLTLVQRYIQPQDQTITRVEFIGRTFFYAVKVDTSNGFELCPADVCALDGGFCATEETPKFAFQIDTDFEQSAIGQHYLPKMRQVMEDEGLDVAAFELVVDAAGQPYFYDINTNTNYNSDAEERADLYAMKKLAQYLADTLKAEIAAKISLAS